MSRYLAEKHAILIEEAEIVEKLSVIYDEFLYKYFQSKNRPNKYEKLPLSEQINRYTEQEFINNITV